MKCIFDEEAEFVFPSSFFLLNSDITAKYNSEEGKEKS